MGHYPEKKALVLGAGGFIGSHMVKRLKKEGYWVRGVDLDHPEFGRHEADEFVIGDLRDKSFVNRVVEFKGWQGNFYNQIPYKMIESFDEIYQFAADMGGAGFIFTGENDADIMHNSATINLNLLDAIVKAQKEDRTTPKVFYSSSACAYPSHIQEEIDNPGLKEEDAYPANPDSEYGWENYSLRDCIIHIVVIIISLCVLQGIITSMGLKVHGKVEEKKLLLQFVERLHQLDQENQLIVGVMENKQDHSCTLMIV